MNALKREFGYFVFIFISKRLVRNGQKRKIGNCKLDKNFIIRPVDLKREEATHGGSAIPWRSEGPSGN